MLQHTSRINDESENHPKLKNISLQTFKKIFNTRVHYNVSIYIQEIYILWHILHSGENI